MTQELIQQIEGQAAGKPAYTDWLRSLKEKVETADAAEQEETRWRLRYGKT